MNSKERGTRLLDAIVEDKQEEALTILKKGADFTLVRKGDNALHLAARKGWMDVIKTMCSKGANLNQKNVIVALNTDFLLPLRNVVCKAMLYKSGDFGLKTVHGNTVAHYAAKGGYLQLLHYLKHNGVDLNTSNDTRFHLDAELASAMFQKFLDKRQEAAVYIDGHAPLHEAVVHQTMDVIEALVDLGMDPNLQSKVSGETAMHTAAIYGRQPALEGLLIKGASSQITNFEHKKPEDVAKSSTFREIIRMYEALKTAIKTGYIQAQGMKLDVQAVSHPVTIDRVGVIIEHIDIPREFPTTFYCRREKTENSTVALKTIEEEHVFSDVFHVQISDVPRDCAVKLSVPLYKTPTEKEEMVLRFINHEEEDKVINEYITKGKTNYCPVETTLVPETTCVCVIHVRPKREDTEISFEGTVIKSEIEKGFSLEIPAKAFAEKTVLSLKVYDSHDDETNDSKEPHDDDQKAEHETPSGDAPSAVTELSATETKQRETAPVNTELVTDVFQVNVTGQQPQKGLIMQLPMLKSCQNVKNLAVIRMDEATLSDDTLPEVLPLKPQVANGNIIFEVSHFCIYVAVPKALTAKKEDLMSAKSRVSSAKDRRKAVSFFAMIKQIEGHKHTLLVDCGLASKSERRFDRWLKEDYEKQDPDESEAIMLTPGDTFYVSMKGKAEFEDPRDPVQRKLTFSQCRASFQAFHVKLNKTVRMANEARVDVIVSKKMENGLKEVGRLQIRLHVPPPSPKTIKDQKKFKPPPADKSPYTLLREIFGKSATPKKK